jgi:hypothetical protein
MIIIAHGITGNKYVLSDSVQELADVCIDIGKSTSSIRYVEKYKKYAIRIKSKKHKQMLKHIEETEGFKYETFHKTIRD